MNTTKRHYLATITLRNGGARVRECGHWTSAAAANAELLIKYPDAVAFITRETAECDAPTPSQ